MQQITKGTIEITSDNKLVFLPEIDESEDFFIGLLKPSKERVDKSSYKLVQDDFKCVENDSVFALIDDSNMTSRIAYKVTSDTYRVIKSN